MRRALEAIWAVLIWLFAVMIPVQFYLAGHGAMEGAHAADKSIVPMSDAWGPHAGFGTLMALVSLLALLVALGARPPRPLLPMTGALFVAMVIQFFLPFLDDSASTRWIAALHAVNALIVTGLAIGLAFRSRPYLPFTAGRGAATEEPSLAGSEPG